MKNKYFFLLLFCIPLFMGSCIKNNLPTIGGELYVEFDATVFNTPLTGQTYPVLTRVPAYGAAVVAANPLITRGSGTVKFRVNLVGAQQSTDQVINFKAVTAPTLPAGVTLAASGTHYTITGTITIPAKSSYGEAVITIVNPGVSSATPVGLVLELTGNDLVKPSNNYRFLGMQISQS